MTVTVSVTPTSDLTGEPAYVTAQTRLTEARVSLTAAVTGDTALTPPLQAFDKVTGGTAMITCADGLTPSYGTYGCGMLQYY